MGVWGVKPSLVLTPVGLTYSVAVHVGKITSGQITTHNLKANHVVHGACNRSKNCRLQPPHSVTDTHPQNFPVVSGHITPGVAAAAARTEGDAW